MTRVIMNNNNTTLINSKHHDSKSNVKMMPTKESVFFMKQNQSD